ncbi:MAG TPA: nucleoside-diphosphate kinase [Candidatus Sumerlaeota bacterium]|nr:MAG: Nucleoside diphosphate kinase [candidate division BRC1 bacterium ADurb.BinA292]HPK03328.1 nucleoside-diphosphate kinase [Candidatus Sumerlaeota bacterium]
MALERTLVLVKPDGVRRGLVGEIIGRFERKGLRIAGLRMLRFDDALAQRHYAEHVEKPFFPELKEFITSGPVVAIAVEGDMAIEVVRAMMGKTKFFEAAPGTIRGDLAFSTTENLVHGSDSPASAARELPLFFTEDQLFV